MCGNLFLLLTEPNDDLRDKAKLQVLLRKISPDSTASEEIQSTPFHVVVREIGTQTSTKIAGPSSTMTYIATSMHCLAALSSMKRTGCCWPG